MPFVETIKDGNFVRNFIILVLFVFVLLGISIMYFKEKLEINHFWTAIDIAIGIVVGNYILKGGLKDE